jgi:hypothetical protein
MVVMDMVVCLEEVVGVCRLFLVGRCSMVTVPVGVGIILSTINNKDQDFKFPP